MHPAQVLLPGMLRMLVQQLQLNATCLRCLLATHQFSPSPLTCRPEGLWTATTCASHQSTSKKAGASGSLHPGRRCSTVALGLLGMGPEKGAVGRLVWVREGRPPLARQIRLLRRPYNSSKCTAD